MSGALPKFIDLGYKRISMIVTEAMDEDEKGAYHSGANIIQILAGQVPANEAVTVLHELGHGIFDVFGANSDPEMEKVEERVVELMAVGFVEAFQRNPGLLNYLARRLKQRKSHG